MTETLIQQLEKRRLWNRGLLMGCFGISGIVIGYVSNMFQPQIIGFIVLVFAVLNIYIFIALQRHFKRKGKALFLTTMAEEFNLIYDPSHAFDVASVRDHGIVPPYDVKLTEDGFTHTSNEFPIAFQEVTLRQIEEVEKNKRHINQVFHGLMIKIKLKRKLDFHTIIIPNKFLRPTVEAGSIPNRKGFEEVKIVSNKFTKAYKVHSTHQIESRVLFDPLFIERWMELGQHLGAKWMEASFMGDEMLIMAQYPKDHFEIGSILRPVMEDDLDTVREEIKHILGMAEILKHNTYIG